LVRKGEISKRLDAYYHRLDFKKLREKYTNEGFYFVGKLINSWDRGDGPREGFYTEDSDNGVYFLRINNLKNNSIDLTGVKFINRVVHEKTLKRSKVSAGDLIFAISGTKDNLGTVSIVPDFILEANLNSALVRLNLDFSKVDKKYFCLLFSLAFVRTQIDYIGKGAAQNNLNNEEISQIQIPLPSLEKQNTIVSIFENAKDVKHQKENEAAQLLASIDDYLLEALGITLPPPSEKKTYFLTRSSQVSGGRFDPFYHQVEFEENKTVVKNGHYKAVPLKQLVEKLVKGKLPKDTEKDGDLKVIQINSINPDGHIDTSDLLTAQAIFTREQQMQKNDVLVVITGATIGKVAIWEFEENEEYFLGGDIVKFQCLKNINPQFIFAWLRCQNSQIEIKKNVTGATNGHLSPSDIGNILIPLPSPEKQTEIATHISALRTQAKQLQQQAADELAHAKLHVEHLILGE
jgi:restriction endonuclease S subunit